MKRILMIAIAMTFSMQAMAESEVRKAVRLSQELAQLNVQLELAKESKSGNIKSVVISTGVAAVLGFLSYKLIQAKGGDISGPASVLYGVVGTGITAAVVVYDGVQMIQLNADVKAIPALKKSIADKKAEIDLVIQADDEAQKALTEINK